MFALARRSGLRLLTFGAVAAIAFSACGGNSGTPTLAPLITPSPTTAVAATDTPAPTTATTGCDLTAATAALANLDSYQFKMTLAGGAADVLQDLPIDPADSYVLKGTVVNKPAPATDLTIGKFHLIEVGGYDYFDADGNGSFTQVGPDQGAGGGDPGATPTSGPSGADSGAALASQFSPQTLFGNNVASSGSNGYTLAGTEEKGGVQANHCSAGQLALEQYGSTLGVTDATWTADIWLAVDGGYPVSVALVAKAKDGTLPYEILLDLSKVNDPANKVTAPTNIGGA